jgi:hypothetical protein
MSDLPLLTPSLDLDAFINKAFADAIKWKKGEGIYENWTTVERIFRVHRDTIRSAIKRQKQKQKHKQHGVHNKLLWASQEEAIWTYCYDQ